MEYVAFEVDRANIGRRIVRNSSDGERTVAKLAVRWNRVFIAQRAQLRICPAFRATGTYWLAGEHPQPVALVRKLLFDAPSRDFAVFTVEEFLRWYAAMKTAINAPPTVLPGRRATPGAVIDLNVDSGPPPPVGPDDG